MGTGRGTRSNAVARTGDWLCRKGGSGTDTIWFQRKVVRTCHVMSCHPAENYSGSGVRPASWSSEARRHVHEFRQYCTGCNFRLTSSRRYAQGRLAMCAVSIQVLLYVAIKICCLLLSDREVYRPDFLFFFVFLVFFWFFFLHFDTQNVFVLFFPFALSENRIYSTN